MKVHICIYMTFCFLFVHSVMYVGGEGFLYQRLEKLSKASCFVTPALSCQTVSVGKVLCTTHLPQMLDCHFLAFLKGYIKTLSIAEWA